MRTMHWSRLALVATLMWWGCGSPTETLPPPPPPQLATIELTPSADTLISFDETTQLTASAFDDTGASMTGVTFTWVSSDPQIATVSSTGLVTAVGEGTVSITASSASVSSAAAAILVDQFTASVVVTPGTASVAAVGSTTQFTAVASDANQNEIVNPQFIWLSSNHAVATVDETGLATAVGQGTVTISAASGGVPGMASFSVSQVVSSVAIVGLTSVTLTAIESAVTLAAEALDANNVALPNADIAWSSDAPGVATVGLDGTVTAVLNGFATITASSGGQSATVAITVAQAVSAAISNVSVPLASLPADGFSLARINVTLRDANGYLVAGETVSFTVTATPNLTGAFVTQPGSASDANGVVDGTISSTSFGSKMITATVDPGGDAIQLFAQPSVSFGATNLQWTVQPQTAESGTRWGNAAVSYMDADGNVVTTATRPVTIGLSSNPSAGNIMGGALTGSPQNGVVTFDAHGIAFPGTGYGVTAQASGLTHIVDATSDPFDVNSRAIVDALTTLSLADDDAASVLFSTFSNFAFYGILFGSVQITSNGFLAFSTAAVTAFTNQSIPSPSLPNAVVAGFWDDFNPAQGGAVRWSVTGTTPDRRFVVEYDQVPYFFNTGSARFNIILHETTNIIEFVYGTISGGGASRDTGGSATIGIESNDGLTATQIGFNQANTIVAGLRMLFEFDTGTYVRIMMD